jgi:hypothetical protein
MSSVNLHVGRHFNGLAIKLHGENWLGLRRVLRQRLAQLLGCGARLARVRLVDDEGELFALQCPDLI